MIWKRYFLREFAKMFFLVIFSAYFLFVLIDYSAHTKSFHQPGICFFDIILYYLYQFTKQAEILVSLALLLATIKVLTTLNIRREIVALATSGISMQRIKTPFFLAATVGMLFLYANFQWFEPKSLGKLEAFESRFFKEKNSIQTHAARLKDGSTLLYHHFDIDTQHLHDIFWVKDFDHIYHIDTLDPINGIATHVDKIKRANGLHVVDSIDKLPFEIEQIDPKSFMPKSLTEMMHASKWSATLFYKLTIPLSALLAVVMPAPFCLRFSRQTPTYMIYAISLFAFITYFALMQALLIAFKT